MDTTPAMPWHVKEQRRAMAMLPSALTTAERLLYSVMLDFVDDHGWARVSRAELARQSALDGDYVKKLLRGLRSIGVTGRAQRLSHHCYAHPMMPWAAEEIGRDASPVKKVSALRPGDAEALSELDATHATLAQGLEAVPPERWQAAEDLEIARVF